MRYTTIGSDPLSARTVSVLSLGAMRFGTTTDEATSFAILDRYAAAGGNFIDTSNNYLFFVNGRLGRRERGAARPVAGEPQSLRSGNWSPTAWSACSA
jgi:aryl-alcohol dehydrogenase-like predicted oxidoreductase